jgi:uncharacterized protein YccT (UPF0319 family)
MAEVKNSFLQSKMNKDLDDRLIPNGEYRDALNISVGKSEDKDVGALETTLGNQFMVLNNPINNNLVCIGQIADNQNNRIFQFWTDYWDSSNGELTPATSGDMRITMYTANSTVGVLTTLVSGVFLNFARNNPYRIIGLNILEDLLFWTDNRNQPRKINITKAISNPNYYTTETQISVAKYAPVFPISMYSDIIVTATSNGVIPTSPTGNSESIVFDVSSIDALKLSVGMQLINSTTIGPNDYFVIIKISGNTITLSIPASISISIGDELNFVGTTMSNKSEDPSWSGDPNYLKDKYVRFSYRFRYDDGEYSLMAPFTQILFIPNQNGYFLNGDEDSAYRSTVVSWMENYINNIVLQIELPDTGNNIESSYKITSIDILYKESDAVAVKVLETVLLNQIASVAQNTNQYFYTYKSQKPYKTLPENQTVRVYDKTPVRARSQEIVGNRVVYGNVVSQSTPPAGLDYNLAVITKSAPFESWAEYPNHTLKQNRNYQAGFVLSDKFGRQSSVILSSNDLAVTLGGTTFVGSTIYSPYFSEQDSLNVKDWRGNCLALILNSPISSNRNEGAGTPGLYAIVSGINGQTGNGFTITAGTVIGNSYTYTLAALPAQRNYPVAGSYIRGKYTDYVKVLPGAVEGFLTTDGEINDVYNFNSVNVPDVKYAYDLNQLGWYSYKIVVRQQQQEYYNVYLPGMLNGYPMFQTSTAPGTYPTPASNPTIFPIGETNKTAHTVLLNDNINKIPRDLTEVGPDQKQYRSSVELYGRVQNSLISSITYNQQYYPAKKADVASTIATSSDLTFLPTDEQTNQYGTASKNFYQLSTKPIIARISTVNEIGVIATNDVIPAIPNEDYTMNPYLSIYETAPVVSLLDLFWESTTAGLISDLNSEALISNNAAFDFDEFEFTFNEYQDYQGIALSPPGAANCPFITNYFQPINLAGLPMTTVSDITMTVKDLTNGNRTTNFELVGPSSYKYAIKIKNPFTFLIDASSKESYEFTFNITDVINGNSVIVKTGSLSNSIPIITQPVLTDPIQEITISSPPLLGPIFECTGTNGATEEVGNPTFNEQQLQWSILNTSTPENWDDYFSIDPVNGVISIINTGISPIDTYVLNIRVRDVYNFPLNSPGTGSLYADSSLVINSLAAASYCGEWTSEVTLPFEGFYNNHIEGRLNFWTQFFPGETIDVSNTFVYVFDYTTYPVGASYFPNSGTGQLTFSSLNYNGTFNFDKIQITDGPVRFLHVVGNIRVLPSGRNITVDLTDEAYVDILDVRLSAADTCTVYIPPTPRSWQLTNGNTSSSINWTALSSTGGTVLGGTLAPAEFTGSSIYGCIKENTLSYGSGGVASYGSC